MKCLRAIFVFMRDRLRNVDIRKRLTVDKAIQILLAGFWMCKAL